MYESFSERRCRHHAGILTPEPAISVGCDDIIGPVPNRSGNDLEDTEQLPRAGKVARQANRRIGFHIRFPVRDEDECLRIIRVKAKVSHELRAGRGLEWRESEYLIGLMGQDELHRICAEIAYAIEDDDVVQGGHHHTGVTRQRVLVPPRQAP